jgi:hypothetical protein
MQDPNYRKKKFKDLNGSPKKIEEQNTVKLGGMY